MKLKPVAALLLMVCMIACSVGLGAYKGWQEERARVEETYAGLEAMILTRVESAYNLLTVAGRHLPAQDERVLAVARCRDILEGNFPLAQKAQANEDLTRQAEALLEALRGLPSLLQDSRDVMYVENYLPQMLAESEERAAGANYNSAAAQFNSRLRSSFSGWLATLMGVQAAEEFIDSLE